MNRGCTEIISSDWISKIRDFKHIIQTNQIKNCPLTVASKSSEKIFGLDVYAIKGKSARKN